MSLSVRFWWQVVTWFTTLFVIQAHGRFWKSGIMYISILSLCLWKGEALNSKNFNTIVDICRELHVVRDTPRGIGVPQNCILNCVEHYESRLTASTFFGLYKIETKLVGVNVATSGPRPRYGSLG
jgi:hypothetical protein